MLLIFAAIIAPLILCMVAGLGLAATRIYKHVTAEMSDSSKRGEKGGKIDNDRGANSGQGRREARGTPPHKSPHPEHNQRTVLPAPSATEPSPNTEAAIPQPRTVHTTKQVLDEIKCPPAARRAIRGEIVDLVMYRKQHVCFQTVL